MKSPFLHTYRRRIAFAETDAAGAAHFSVLFRLAEEAEHEFLERLGLCVLTEETGWPRLAARAEFRAPLRFGDLVEVRLGLRELKTSSVTWRFHLHRVSDGSLAADGEIITCYVRRNTDGWQPCPLPGMMRSLLSNKSSREYSPEGESQRAP